MLVTWEFPPSFPFLFVFESITHRNNNEKIDLTSKASELCGVQLPVKGCLSIAHQQLLRPCHHHCHQRLHCHHRHHHRRQGDHDLHRNQDDDESPCGTRPHLLGADQVDNGLASTLLKELGVLIFPERLLLSSFTLVMRMSHEDCEGDDDDDDNQEY